MTHSIPTRRSSDLSGGFWYRLAPDRRHDDTRRRIDAADVAISEPARTTARIVHRHGGRDGHLCRRAGAHNGHIVGSQHACGCGEITAGIEGGIDRQAKPPAICAVVLPQEIGVWTCRVGAGHSVEITTGSATYKKK